VPITWYINGSWSIPEGVQRFPWYGFGGTPSAMFDGVYEVVGGQSSGSMFPTYDPIVAGRLGSSSPLLIDASYALAGLNGSLNVQIEVTEDILGSDHEVCFVIVEDDAHSQVNLARLMLPNEPFDLTTPGQTVDIVREFTLAEEWDQNNLDIVVFVQRTSGVKEVLQAAFAVPDYTATVIVDPEPDGLKAPWQIEGPSGYVSTGAGDQTLLVWYEGTYTLTWLPVEGWSPPDPNPVFQLVVQDDIVTFTGTYSDGPFAEITAGPLGDAGPGRGVAMLDFDEDGDLDLHVINSDQPDLMLRNDGGDSFTDIASGPLADPGAGQAAAWADYDNDGDLDVYLARYDQANVLLRNEGGGVFTEITGWGLDDPGPGCGVSWSDHDGDGLVDLHLVNEGLENRLLKSYGDLGGGDWIWVPIGGVISDPGPGACAAWGDFDNDGDSDVYLTNRFAPNKLFQNNGTLGFFDATGSGILADIGNGAGTAWGDYDNDGDLDLYVANDGMADLLARNSGGSFSVVIGGPLQDPGHGRGVIWCDLDNDADLDLYVSRYGEADLYLRNDGGGAFTRVPLGWPGVDGNGCAAVAGDYDNDGDLDIYVVNDGQTNILLQNQAPGTNHWFQVRLQGTSANRSAIGSRLRVVADGVSQIREISAGSGYYAQNPLGAHFGLGPAALVDSLVIRWPDGEVQVQTTLAADQHLLVVQGTSTAVGDSDVASRVVRLYPCHPNPFNPATRIRFSLPSARRVSLAVYSADGRRVATLVDEQRTAGDHEVIWRGQDDQGRQVASGAYFYRLVTEDFQATGSMVLVK